MDRDSLIADLESVKNDVQQHLPSTREKALAVTKLEEAMMWLEKIAY